MGSESYFYTSSIHVLKTSHALQTFLLITGVDEIFSDGNKLLSCFSTWTADQGLRVMCLLFLSVVFTPGWFH